MKKSTREQERGTARRPHLYDDRALSGASRLMLLAGLLGLILLGCQSGQRPLPTLAPTAIAVQATSPTPTPSTTATATELSVTVPATFTPAPTQVNDTPTTTPTRQPTGTPRPTEPLPNKEPTLTPTTVILDPNVGPPPTAIPTAVPTIESPPGVVNILLLGNDVGAVEGGRTDTLIVVSINKVTKTASMLSLPRDLFVYIPQWTMNRINLALPHGHGTDYPGGGGGLVKDTIQYNFGLTIDYYVRVGFNGFQTAVEAVDGIDVAVSCQLRDWRLKEPELDPAVEENWEMFTLEPGYYHMHGDLALWYARSRRTSNDFARNRRQHQVLHALLNRGLSLDLLPQAPTLWDTYREQVETDIDFATMVELASLAPTIQANGFQSLNLPREAMRSWRVPTTGASVLLPQWEAAEPVLRQLVQPPLLNRATRPPIYVEVITDDEGLYQLAADNLSWYGFVPIYKAATEATPARTSIRYYAPNTKGSFDWLLSWIFGRRAQDVELITAEQPNNIDYQVTLGYDYNPCLSQFDLPTGFE